MKAIRTILACIRKADQKYNLINHGDKIVIGLSGGKDSIALLYTLSLYLKFSHTNFTIQPVTLDLGFSGFNPEPLKDFCNSLGLKLIVNDSKEVYKILTLNQGDNNHLPCSICSKMKKAAINKVANNIGYNKVAFAHHADDAIETLFMNEIYGARIATFSPKMYLEKANIDFIRPFILVRESEIERLIKEEKLPVIGSSCPADKHTSREEIKDLLNGIYKKYPESKENFLTMLDNYVHQDIWDKEIYLQVNQSGLSLKPVVNEIDMAFFHHYIKPNLKSDLSRHKFLIYQKQKAIGAISYSQVDKLFIIYNPVVTTEFKKEIILYIAQTINEKHNPCKVIVKTTINLEKEGFKKASSNSFEISY